jgi:predicted nucleotidyltransferase
MCELCKKSISSDKEIDKNIKNLMHSIIREYTPEKVILFGSFARGDYHQGSDIDLVVVGDFKKRFFDRIGKILELDKSNIELDALVYTGDEFDRMVREKRPFIMNILRGGIVAHGGE